MSGAWQQPPHWQLLLFTGFALGGIVWLLARLNQPRPEANHAARNALRAWLAPGAALAASVAVAAALSVSGTVLLDLLCLWLPLLAGAGAVPPDARKFLQRILLRRRGPSQPAASPAAAEAPVQAPAAAHEPPDGPLLLEEPPSEMEFDAAIVQRFVRRRDDAGRESIEAQLQVVFSAGQRTAHAHLAFCPPFARSPQVQCAQADGPEARIAVGQVLPYGARLDLRLGEPAEEACSVWLEVCVQGPPCRDSA